MLQFFPTPYPDELWYSILCRYHVRSGNPSPFKTTRDLGIKYMNLFSFMPNGAIDIIVNQLPKNLLNTRDIILNNTPFKYSYRFYAKDRKEDILKAYETDKVIHTQRLCRIVKEEIVLKSCPLCMEEDLKKYGETYWHLSHQFPLVCSCKKHKCRLLTYTPGDRRKRVYDYILPNVYNGDIDYNISENEYFLTDTSLEYQYLPLDVSPDGTHNNLINGLINNGFGMLRDGAYFLNTEKIASSLCELYGSDMIKKYFVREKIDGAIFFQMRRWNIKSPERYALLANMIKQPAAVTFDSHELKINTYEKLRKMSMECQNISKIYIANQLGIKQEHLDAVASHIGIERFWEREFNKKETKMVISLSNDEKKQINDYAKAHGYTHCSDFVLGCIKTEMNSNL